MASNQGAVDLDANVIIAIVSKEPLRDASATNALALYSGRGFGFYAPGAAIVETLYVLCQKLVRGELTPTSHASVIKVFEDFFGSVLPPPNGDGSLILRANQIQAGYGCSRSADSIYIALAEELAQSVPTV